MPAALMVGMGIGDCDEDVLVVDDAEHDDVERYCDAGAGGGGGADDIDDIEIGCSSCVDRGQQVM